MNNNNTPINAAAPSPLEPSQLPSLTADAKLRPIVVKPLGYSLSSITTYYTKKHGTQLRAHLDALIANPDKAVSFSARTMQCSVKTLHMRINLAWKWIIDNDDPTECYRNLRERTTTLNAPGQVRLVPARGAVELTSELVPLEDEDVVVPPSERDEQDIAVWKEGLVKYVEEAPEGELHICVARLKPYDMDFVRNYLIPFEDNIALLSINSRGFKLVKNSVLAKRMKDEATKR